MKKKCVLIGANSYIGKSLSLALENHFSVIRTSTNGVNGTIKLDLRNTDDFSDDIFSNETIVIFLAAISSPDECARNFEEVWSINVEGSAKIIQKALSSGSKVIFFSSDIVYGSNETYIDEEVVPNPFGEYALMKHEVEKKFLNESLFKSIRLSFVFSKFDKFTKYLTDCNSKEQVAEVFHPFLRSVIYINDVVDGVISLSLNWNKIHQRIINFGGPELLSRVDLAYLLKVQALANLKFEIIEPDFSFFKSRPRVIAMKSELLTSILGRPLWQIKDAIQNEFAIN